MVKLTKPRPPICTNTNTTALPNRVSPEARSNRVSPVTVTADTAVKNASNQPMDLVVDQGSFKSRSEEHTSELQSRGHLVCRLLLEKKKQTSRQAHHMSENDEDHRVHVVQYTNDL